MRVLANSQTEGSSRIAAVWFTWETILTTSPQALDASVSAAREDISRWDSETKYKTLFDSIDEGFCVIKVLRRESGECTDYAFLEVNPSFERQTGLAGAVGQSMLALAPAHEAHWFQTYGEVARTGMPVRFEAAADALARWYDVYAFRVGDPGQDLVGVLFNDVTRRKDLERAVENQNEILRTADARKDQFLATLSHELRNPLEPIRNGLRIIKLLSAEDERLLPHDWALAPGGTRFPKPLWQGWRAQSRSFRSCELGRPTLRKSDSSESSCMSSMSALIDVR